MVHDIDKLVQKGLFYHSHVIRQMTIKNLTYIAYDFDLIYKFTLR
jgi:hypothetical protein